MSDAFGRKTSQEVIAELTERIEVLKKLVRSAFNEGVSSGMDEFRKSNGGRTWFDSDARKLLEDDKP